MLERAKDAAAPHKSLSEVPQLGFSPPDGMCPDMLVRDRTIDGISLLCQFWCLCLITLKKRSDWFRWALLAGGEQLSVPVKGSAVAGVRGKQESQRWQVGGCGSRVQMPLALHTDKDNS